MSETDEEILFKNQFRGRKVAKVESYQPEHERLGVEPIQYPINKEEDSAFLQTQKYPPQSKIVETGTSKEVLWTESSEEKPITPPSPAGEWLAAGSEDNSFKLDKMEVGQYVIIYNDNVLCVGTKQHTEEFIMEFLSNNSLEISELTILKRVNIKAGIFVDE